VIGKWFYNISRFAKVSNQCAIMGGGKCKEMTMSWNLGELLQVTFNYNILHRQILQDECCDFLGD